MSMTEVTNESWFSRIVESFKGILVGLLLFVVSFPLLFWNEGRAVRRAKTLTEGRGAVVDDVATDVVNPANENKLVHMTGEATSDETLTDAEFGVSAEQVIALRRTVQMYQWKEEKHTKEGKKLGGGKERVTTYDWQKVWEDRPIDSSQFNPKGRDTYGNGNPPMPFKGSTTTAGRVGFGAFSLSSGLVRKIVTFEPLPVGDQAPPPSAGDTQFQVVGGGFYRGADPQSPQIGDLKISFEVVRPTQVSLIAEQTGETFRPFQAKGVDGSIELLEIGNHSADAMFAAAEAANVQLTWILRFVGFLAMALGIGFVFRPLAVFGDLIPIVGSILAGGIAIFAAVIAGAFSLTTIAIAWLFYRPLLGVILIVIAIGLVVGAKMIFKGKAAAAK